MSFFGDIPIKKVLNVLTVEKHPFFAMVRSFLQFLTLNHCLQFWFIVQHFFVLCL